MRALHLSILLPVLFVAFHGTAFADPPAAATAASTASHLESELASLDGRVAELASQAGHEASNGAVDHVTHAVAVAREALAVGDTPRATRALDVAKVALVLAERQAARARALQALELARRARADAESRRNASRAALESARADRGRLEATP